MRGASGCREGCFIREIFCTGGSCCCSSKTGCTEERCPIEEKLTMEELFCSRKRFPTVKGR